MKCFVFKNLKFFFRSEMEQNQSCHLRGDYLAYWEHELGKNMICKFYKSIELSIFIFDASQMSYMPLLYKNYMDFYSKKQYLKSIYLTNSPTVLKRIHTCYQNIIKAFFCIESIKQKMYVVHMLILICFNCQSQL